SSAASTPFSRLRPFAESLRRLLQPIPDGAGEVGHVIRVSRGDQVSIDDDWLVVAPDASELFNRGLNHEFRILLAQVEPSDPAVLHDAGFGNQERPPAYWGDELLVAIHLAKE